MELLFHRMRNETRLNDNNSQPLFIYTYGCREEELSLCQLEMRAFFSIDSKTNILTSPIDIHPDRSPFLRERIEVLYDGDTLQHIHKQVEAIVLGESTFKVIFIKMNDLAPEVQYSFEEKRAVEREIGMHIDAEADVHQPDYVYGLITLGGRWYFGNLLKSKAVWLDHMKKPRSYSIALSTRDARAIANIAVPNPQGVRAIDPCCGIGTVLVEALSMGINIVGRDINTLIVDGANENLVYFGYDSKVILGDIADIAEAYDVAIIDMPYNHYSRSTPEEQLSLLLHAHRIANKVVIVTADPIDEMIAGANLHIADRGIVRKGNFIRHIIVCT